MKRFRSLIFSIILAFIFYAIARFAEIKGLATFGAAYTILWIITVIIYVYYYTVKAMRLPEGWEIKSNPTPVKSGDCDKVILYFNGFEVGRYRSEASAYAEIHRRTKKYF